MNEGSVVEVHTTAGSREDADRIGHECVVRGLAACAQVSGPVTSYYRWMGELHRETEWKVAMKTFKVLEQRLMEIIREMHPYETPEIASLPVDSVLEAYREWMSDNLFK